jgi:trk system potassium uptake protein TrkH
MAAQDRDGAAGEAIGGRTIKLPPPALLALLYAAFIAAGALLLKLPAATTAPISWSDAFFTATSAVTVTGLVVVDTGSAFTLFGQIVVATLIQLGGLGLMTFAVLVLASLGLPIGMRQRVYLREDLNQTSVSELLYLVFTILKVVLAMEAIGIAALAFVFVPEFGWGQGLWHAIFHTISAFNNAGFALFPDSLTRWATDPVVNITVPLLFIVSGVGFAVLSDLARTRAWRPLMLHSKLTLAGTGALIVLSVIGFAALEWNNPGTLGPLETAGDKLWVSWFQGVTTRTAGFNTADTGAMYDATTMMTMGLMVIGGGSTSTAGGIKVTTFVVLILATIAFFRRRERMRAFGRSLGPEQAFKVMALTTVAIFLILTSIFAMSITWEGEFIDLAFEVTSAFGTVGLSRGATGELDALGRAVIMLLMFLGRVGPLTLGFFLATQIPSRIRYPESKIYIG